MVLDRSALEIKCIVCYYFHSYQVWAVR